MHEGKSAWHKTESWVDVVDVEGGICVKSVRAFTKRKFAKEWLDKKGWTHLKIVSAEVN